MRKGNTVVVAANTTLWRPVTQAETDQWYADKRAATEAARAAGKDTFDINFDCAGESRLPPKSTYRRDTTGEFTVVRARVEAPGPGYSTTPGCCLLRATDGTEWYVRRGSVHVIAGNPNPAPSKNAPTGSEIDEAIKAFVTEISDRNAEYDRTQYDSLWASAIAAGHDRYTIYDVKWGRKYAKVVSRTATSNIGSGGSVFCFVNRENGDILKAASYSAPAKHARGNVLRDDRLSAVGRYGANYLR